MTLPAVAKISKKMSYVLRHKPESIGATLDEQGWMPIETLLAGLRIDRATLDRVVAENNKKRFIIEGDRIRANQGHSVKIDLGYEPATPPVNLYHGTVAKFLDAIRGEGITKQKRHHVHLSADLETATNVGSRRGRPVILKIDTQAMLDVGHEFFVTPNGVWLTEQIPPQFIEFPE